MSQPAERINNFWFVKCAEEDWFKKDLNFDNAITNQFLNDYDNACKGNYDNWVNHPKNCLALIILLDQFSRNMFRDTAKAFSQDKKAQGLSKHALEQDYFSELANNEIFFSLIPLIHSEELIDHEIAHVNCEKYLRKEDSYDKIKQSWNDHTKAIKEFERYPHRNTILGRTSTNDEILFLTQPNSSW
ncbi:DUF924 domain-containing protein [Rhodobacteraceae bacterium]|nr:DUF924 domain-containing protein [Paracoccaceae bacterium]